MRLSCQILSTSEVVVSIPINRKTGQLEASRLLKEFIERAILFAHAL